MQFINPYHFISLSNKPNRQKLEEYDAVQEEKLTGSITYTLTTKSPLFIPNTTSERAFAYTPNPEDDKENEHKLYDFFSYTTLESGKTYDDEYFEPVIPGSEVRGMIRTIYETLTDSCLSVLDDETRISKRTVEQFKAGILIRKGKTVKLYNAKDAIYRNKNDFAEKKYRGEELKDIRDGSLVYFYKVKSDKSFIKNKAISISKTRTKSETIEGYLLKGEKGPDISPKERDKRCQECVNHRNGAAHYCPGAASNRNRDTKEEQHCYLAEKHCAHVFERDKIACEAIDEVTIEELGFVIKQYQKNAQTAPAGRKSEYKEYNDSYHDFCCEKVNGLPVYYSVIDGHYILSPACITREVYRNTEKDIVKEYTKCGSRQKNQNESEQKDQKEKTSKNKSSVPLCAACNLFGTVSDEINKGSKIRFSDLRLTDTENDKKNHYKMCYNEDLLTLEELSTPKISTTEFYLKKPVVPESEGEVWFWTYDYYTVKQKDEKVVLKPYTPEISGRKFYWHNLTGIQNAKKLTKRNRTVRTVREGVSFTGKLYFDEITKTQLKQLLYILQYTSDGRHGYKLGTGKPFGLGSVELEVSSVWKRDFSGGCYMNKPYAVEDYKYTDSDMGFDKQIEGAFSLITSYMESENEKKIHYPQVTGDEGEEGFKWFEENKKAYSIDKDDKVDISKSAKAPNKRTQIKLQKVLPDIMNGDSLPILEGRTQINNGFLQKSPQGGRKDKKPQIENVRHNNASREGYSNDENARRKRPVKSKVCGLKASMVRQEYDKINSLKGLK